MVSEKPETVVIPKTYFSKNDECQATQRGKTKMKSIFFPLMLVGCIFISASVWAGVKADNVKIKYEITEGDGGAALERRLQEPLEVLDSEKNTVAQSQDTADSDVPLVIKKELV